MRLFKAVLFITILFCFFSAHTEEKTIVWPEEVHLQIRAVEDPDYIHYVEEQKKKEKEEALAIEEQQKIRDLEFQESEKQRLEYVKHRETKKIKYEHILSAYEEHAANVIKYRSENEKAREEFINERRSNLIHEKKRIAEFKVKLTRDPAQERPRRVKKNHKEIKFKQQFSDR